MQLFIITPPNDQEEMSWLSVLYKLYPQLWIHIRKPTASYSQVYNYIATLPLAIQQRSIVHQHYRLIETLPIAGLHLGEQTKRNTETVSQVREYKKNIPNLRLSHAAHQIEALSDKSQTWSCVFLSPIFNCISKQATPSFTLEELSLSLKKQTNIVALGGCDASKLPTLQALRFYGVAFLGALWQSKNKLSTWKNIVTINHNLTSNRPCST